MVLSVSESTVLMLRLRLRACEAMATLWWWCFEFLKKHAIRVVQEAFRDDFLGGLRGADLAAI